MSTSLTFDQLLAGAGPVSGTPYRYGDVPGEVGWLHLPTSSPPHPVVLVVHGGCWSQIADARYMGSIAGRVARMGWATWVIEFPRLSGDQTALIGDHRVGAGVEERERVTGEGRDEVPEGVRLLDSVARATDYLRTLAKSESLDLDRIVTLGHSSGGHLALWVAARGTIDGPVAGGSSTPLRIAGAITLAGIVDLRTFEGLPVRGCGDRVRQLLDDDFSPEQLAATSPGAMLPLGVPQLLISGGVDTTVPPHHGSEYSERALSAGDRVEHRVIPRADHFELVAPWTAGGQEVEGAIREFLNGVRRLPPSARGSP